MQFFRRNSISWLLLATFGVIACGGRGLHLVNCITDSCCVLHPCLPSSSAVASCRSGDVGGKHAQCGTKAPSRQEHALLVEALAAGQSNFSEASFTAQGHNSAECAVCQFFCQNSLTDSVAIAEVSQPLVAILDLFSDEVPPASDFDSYLARGPPLG